MRRPLRPAVGPRTAWILCVYLALSAVYTWPLLRHAGSQLPSDPGDPVLNTAILWWNATTLPFSSAWWNAPHYFPSEGVAAFTENLAGISPIFSPVYWLTGNPIAAYNVAFFLTWPLSAFAVFLLVRFLTKRDAPAFIAGLAFAFTPYRTTEIAHIQNLSVYYAPLVLLGMHGYRVERRPRWLALFGCAWLLQSLANGYFMLFMAVVIGIWLAYFCTTREAWRAGAAIAGAWALASLPLVPVMWVYSRVHERFGLVRSLNEILAYSATPHAWFEVSGDAWFWGSILPHGKDDLFPGATALVLVALGALAVLLRRERAIGPASSPTAAVEGRAEQRARLWLRLALGLVAALSTLSIAILLAVGPWTVTIAGLALRMRDLDRAPALAAGSAAALLLLSARVRGALARRSPLVFYAATTLLVALLCCGPVLRVGGHVVLSTTPYGWLMALPGFRELRVPPRFWMLGVLCLSVAAGLAFRSIESLRGSLRLALFAAAAGGLLLDGWMPRMRMVPAPELWAAAEPRDRGEPILELPIGPDWDWSATFRAAGHRRRVFNGVSGYDPPHYVALRTGLDSRDPAVLAALATLGPLDIVVDRAVDPDGSWTRYAAGAPGAVSIGEFGPRVVYRVPRGPAEPALGDALPLTAVLGFRHDELFSSADRNAPAAFDGRIDTTWVDAPQEPGQWLVADLGGAQNVGGVTLALGDFFLTFPRRLLIEVSADGATWERVWEGAGAPAAFLALVRGPREGVMRFDFGARRAARVRLQQLERANVEWRVAELQVHAPR